MKLRDAVDGYIASRRALATRFTTEADVLAFFLKGVDRDADADAVTRGQVLAFLAGNGRLTQTRALKYCVLNGFYRYAVSRGYATRSPAAVAGGRAEEALTAPTLRFHPRGAAPSLRCLGPPSPTFAEARRAHVSRVLAAALRGRITHHGGAESDGGGRRPLGRLAHGTREQVLQVASGPHRPAAGGGAEGLREAARRPPVSARQGLVLPREPGRHDVEKDHRSPGISSVASHRRNL